MELQNPPNPPSKPEISIESKPYFEIRSGFRFDPISLFKRRKVSAKRDFPSGCGRAAAAAAAEIGGNLSPKDSIADGAVELGGAPAEPYLPEVPKCPDRAIESYEFDSRNAAEPADLLALMRLDRADLAEEPRSNLERRIDGDGEPGGKEVAAASFPDEAEERCLEKYEELPQNALAPVESADGNGNGNAIADAPRRFPRRRFSCKRDFPPGCGRHAPRLLMDGWKEPIFLSRYESVDCLLVENGSVNAENTEVVPKKNVAEESERDTCVGFPFGGDELDGDTKHVVEDGKNGASVEEKLEVEDAEMDDRSPTSNKEVKRIDGDSVKKESVKDSAKCKKVVVASKRKLSDSNVEPQSSIKRVKRKDIVDESGGESGNSKEDVDLATPGKDALSSQSEGEDSSIYLKKSSEKMAVNTRTDVDMDNREETPANHGKKLVPKKITSASGSSRNGGSSEGKAMRKKVPKRIKTSSQQRKKASIKDIDEDKQIVPAAQEWDVTLFPTGPSIGSGENSEEVSPRKKVRDTLRLFQAICRKLLREEEAKSDKAGQSAQQRVNLAAVKILKEKNKCVNTGAPILGPVPGVEIGDEFHYRIELAIVGLHRPYQSGIDYMKRGNTVLAISVVSSGGYADDRDSDVLVYSGSGGKPAEGEKPPEDQKLERGNLALKNSIDAQTPVRVIHGFKELRTSDSTDAKGKMGTTFTYDGLYLVEKYWQGRGQHGYNVFKFQMRRMAGQPELAIKEFKRSKEKMSEREGLCMKDISYGKEKIAIPVVNAIDDDRPLPFRYITKMIYPSWYEPTSPEGCDCTNGCSDSNKCACVMKNGGEIPFNHSGAIVEAKSLVYECGPSCKCPPTCHNRVSQHGIRFPLEVFKTESRGWGVRSVSSIPSGSFICEYAGELLKDTEAEQRINDEYLFDIGKNHTEQSLWDGLSELIPTDSQSNVPDQDLEDGEYTIDAADCGNVGRFINHSCSPNLYAQNVLYDHNDKSMPHIMLFAAENIPPLQELTYHYNYTIGQVRDSSGNEKMKSCYCGSHECTGRLY